MSNGPRLASNLDELLSGYQPNGVTVDRFAGRYEILFKKGKARLLVSVSLESRSYEVGGTVPVAALSLEDVVDASLLFSRVRGFLDALAPLEVRDARR